MAITWTEADQERVLGRLAAIVSDLPGTVVSAGHTDTSYLLGERRFARLHTDHHDNGQLELWIRAARVEPEPARYFVPADAGRPGWVGALVQPEFGPDWDELAALIERAWRDRGTEEGRGDDAP
jgi:hypothetical protein